MDKEDVFGSLIQVAYSMSTAPNGTVSPLKNKRVTPVGRQDDKPNGSPFRPSRILGSVPRDNTKENHVPLDLKSTGVVNIQKSYKQADRGLTDRSNGNTSKECSAEVPKRDVESPDSADSQEGLDKKPNEQLSVGTQQFISHHSMFTNNSYAGIWPSPFYQNIMNLSSQSAGFPGITPLAPSLMGNPLTASWLASLHNFTMVDQQRGGVDLLVTNLDVSVGEKELKKKLASVFREHCKVHIRM